MDSYGRLVVCPGARRVDDWRAALKVQLKDELKAELKAELKKEMETEKPSK